MRAKEGDFALMNDNIIVTVKIVWKQTPIKKAIPSGRWYKFDKYEDTGEFKKEVAEVWWDKLGIDDGIIHTNTFSDTYDWDAMVIAAIPLIKQAKVALEMIEKRNLEVETTNSEG